MITKVSKGLMYISVFFVCLIVFLPTQNIYYSFEKYVKKYDLVFTNESFKENILKFIVKDIDIYYKNIKKGSIEEMEASFFIVTNSIKIQKLRAQKKANSKIFLNIELSYNIFFPTFISIKVQTGKKTLYGKIDLISKRMLFNNQENLSFFIDTFTYFNFKSTQEGFVYEY